MKHKKAQLALEFLMNYSWIILVVLVVILVSLIYFGVIPVGDKFNPDEEVCELTCSEVYEDNYDNIFREEYKKWTKFCDYEGVDSNGMWIYNREKCYKKRPKLFCEKCVDDGYLDKNIIKICNPSKKEIKEDLECNKRCVCVGYEEEIISYDEYWDEHIFKSEEEFILANPNRGGIICDDIDYHFELDGMFYGFDDTDEREINLMFKLNATLIEIICVYREDKPLINKKCLSAHEKEKALIECYTKCGLDPTPESIRFNATLETTPNECEKNNINWVWDNYTYYLYNNEEFTSCSDKSHMVIVMAINTEPSLLELYDINDSCDNYKNIKYFCRPRKFSDLSCEELEEAWQNKGITFCTDNIGLLQCKENRIKQCKINFLGLDETTYNREKIEHTQLLKGCFK